jgi:diguanylate cyclase (GGDEF)-like protein
MKKEIFWDKSFPFQSLVWALFFVVLLWLCFADIFWIVKFFSLSIWFLLFWSYSVKEDWENSQKKKKKLKELLFLLEKLNQAVISQKNKEAYNLAFCFFGKLFETENLTLFVERDGSYILIFSPKMNSFSPTASCFKTDDPFIEKVKTLHADNSFDWVCEFIKTEIGKSLWDDFKYKELFPLWSQENLVGFFLLPQKMKLTEEEKSLLIQAYAQIHKGNVIEKLEHRLKINSQKLEQSNQKIKLETHKLNQELKRKVFDLHALFQVVNNLYETLDREMLISTFMKLTKEHLDAKSILLFFPQKETLNLFPGEGRGTEWKEFSHLVIEKGTPLYQTLSEKNEVLNLYSLQKIFPEDKILVALLRQGLQLVTRMRVKSDLLGLVFLGEKNNGTRYNLLDLEAFYILVNILTGSLDNIKRFVTIEELSYTDSITDLYNYRYFYKRLNEEIFRAKRFNRRLGLVIFDIDEFKSYNDNFGHQAGDSVLKQLGRLLLNTIRSMDIVSRYGGEEFCVIMPETDQSECFKFMDRLRKIIADYSFADEYLGGSHHITISGGGAIFPTDAREPDRLIYCADMALLQAKNLGKNRTVLYRDEKRLVRQI